MRKNLFLTLALAVASFAGAYAQNDWSVTLGSAEGTPGAVVAKDGGNVMLFQSGIIRTAKPIKTLRLTCVANSTSNKPNGNNSRLMLSELNVYNADMTKELRYTVTSNADHNTLTKSFDGQGLKALYDGKCNNYFASMSAEQGAITDYHYLELTFANEIDRFVIEWAGKQGAGEYPTVVVLTEGGKSAEAYTDRSSKFFDQKITTIENLEDASYFTICGNAPTSYNIYANNVEKDEAGNIIYNLGDLKQQNVEGCGPMYTAGGETYEAEPTEDFLAQLVPANNGTYYVYFPMKQEYLSANAENNAFNEAQNGWQANTKNINEAAKVTLTDAGNGDFEMSYELEKNGVKYTVWLGADPRTGRMKTFSTIKKDALIKNGYCEGFAFICGFNWSFYAAEYQAPAWAKEYELSNVYKKIKEFKNAIEDDGTVAGIIKNLDGTLKNVANLTEDEIIAATDKAKEDLANFIWDLGYEEYEAMKTQWGKWEQKLSEQFTDGNYPTASYDELIRPGKELMADIWNMEDDFNPYANVDRIINYFANKEANIAAFEESAYANRMKLPVEYNVEKAQEQEIEVKLKDAITGFRWTLLENHSGNKNNSGYFFTSFTEIEITDKATNEKVTLDAALISTNANEPSEGNIAHMVDGVAEDANFWHVIWGGTPHNPEGNAYLDIKFPNNISLKNFTIKFTTRSNQTHNAQKRFVIDYYAGIDPSAPVDNNPYKVAKGKQITNVNELHDGGLYLLQGNLFVNRAEDPQAPKYFEGTVPSANDDNSINENNVYMLKKVGETWNILSLSNGKYWDKNCALVTFKEKANDVKFVASGNIENAFVIYHEIDTVLKSSEYTIDEVTFPKDKEVRATAQVYMAWDGSLASRPCYSPLPGEADPQFTELTESMKVTSSAGDYLHFNKTNGEGEWNIFEAKMNDAYYVYLQALVEEADELNFIAGTDPGCINADEATAAEFERAKAAAQAAVNSENKNNAETVAKDFIAAIEKMNASERVGFDPTIIYRIQSALPDYKINTWLTRSIQATDNNLTWTVTPENFDMEENVDFLFKITPVAGSEDEYTIWSYYQESFIDGDFAYNPDAGTKYKFIYLEGCQFNIQTPNADNNNGIWHTNQHGNGWGYGSNLVYWNTGANTASAWRFINMSDGNNTSIEDLVIEGDEVVSVSYFTPAGVAIPEPVQGINIVVTVYANGVVEAKKKVVK